jgi:hypothetical protein
VPTVLTHTRSTHRRQNDAGKKMPTGKGGHLTSLRSNLDPRRTSSLGSVLTGGTVGTIFTALTAQLWNHPSCRVLNRIRAPYSAYRDYRSPFANTPVDLDSAAVTLQVSRAYLSGVVVSPPCQSTTIVADIRGVTPRTTRQPNWNLLERAPLVQRTTMLERAVRLSKALET